MEYTEPGSEKRRRKRVGRRTKSMKTSVNTRIRSSNRRGSLTLIMTAVLCIIALGALTGCIVLLLENLRLKQVSEVMALTEVNSPAEPLSEEAATDAVLDSVPEPIEQTYTEEEVQEISEALAEQAADEAADEVLNRLKTQLVEGEDFSAILREFYPEEIVVVASGSYHFIPISESLEKHSYNKDLFILDDQEILTYQDENGTVLSRKGIDVSRYQGDIDWSKVAGDGVEFAIIRLGIRGSAEGTLVLDPTYDQNMQGAAANGIDTGVYFYTQALDEAEAVEEAEFVLEHLSGYDIAYPVVLDVEYIETADPRTKDMSQEDWTKVTIAFCERIKAAGYTPMIYGNLRSFMLMLDMEQLEEYEKWFAFFRTPIYFPYEHSMWQYSNKGRVDGINGDVDLNISMREVSEEMLE